MRKRVQIALAVLLVGVIGVIAWQVLRERESLYQGKGTKFEVVGAVTPKDATEIQRLVRREKWRGTFLDHSIKGIAQLPRDVKSRLSRHLVRVICLKGVTPDGVVWADVGNDREPNTWWRYEVKQGTNGWRVFRITRSEPVAGIRCYPR